MVPFEAAGRLVTAMDGRLWHTSGANVTANEERALLFGYYARDVHAGRRPIGTRRCHPRRIAQLSPRMHTWLGLGASANISLAAALVIGRDA